MQSTYWRRFATAAMPGLDLNSTHCLRLPKRESRTGYRNCGNTKKRCSPIRTEVRPCLAAAEIKENCECDRSLRQQRPSLDIPGDVVHGAVGGEDRRLAGRERESDQPLARDFKVRLALGSDFHDAAFAGK